MKNEYCKMKMKKGNWKQKTRNWKMELEKGIGNRNWKIELKIESGMQKRET